ncbi:transaldolase family protein [Chondromyces apiculatus]|uniref:Transaldolase n=1 Tax=Chondromyces apiculatus DSM 436 TaxID=1192034 RepID=A0A017SXY9_9BACT|nr:transaldolase family protein [Chondromyces apiculatus]EYF01612.1 Transaldolase [Chondromyces apiculatus DSM 436]
MLFLDSSNPAEIRELFAWGVLGGVTTNPLILSREAKDAILEERMREVIAASHGPVSVELIAETEAEMLEEARAIHAWDPARICVKVPFGEAGLRVTHALAKAGVRTNVTCVMNFNQAYLAALAGGTYVSIFSGRIRDMGYDAREVIEQTRARFDRERLTAEVLVGSIRHIADVNEALFAGAHVVTVPPPILRKMLHNPKTDETIREFNAAWANRGK